MIVLVEMGCGVIDCFVQTKEVDEGESFSVHTDYTSKLIKVKVCCFH